VHEHDDLDALRPARRPPDRADGGPNVARSAADPRAAGLLELQRLAGNAAVSRALARDEDEGESGGRSPVLDVVGQGGGSPLPSGVREEMEGRLGADFTDVRVHSDTRASDSAREVNAHAYTVGSDVVFRADRWAPDSTEGKRTLAHELTHVVQQRSGPVAGTPAGGGIRLSDPSDDFEQAAEQAADSAMAATLPVATPQGSAPAAQRQDEEEEEVQELSAQRQEEEEEEEVQELSAQRQEEGEEEEEEEVQGLAEPTAQRQEEGEQEEELAAG
jgi:hypothetical protein